MLKTIPEEINKSLPTVLTDSQQSVAVYSQTESGLVLLGLNYGKRNKEISPRLFFQNKQLKVHEIIYSTRKSLILLNENPQDVLRDEKDVKVRLAYFGTIKEAIEEFKKEGFEFYREGRTYAHIWNISDRRARQEYHEEFVRKAKEANCSLQDFCEVGESLTKESLLELLLNN